LVCRADRVVWLGSQDAVVACVDVSERMCHEGQCALQ